MWQFVINYLLAALFSLASYALRWWAPMLVFPIYLILAPKMFRGKLSIDKVYVMRLIYYLLSTAYVISQALIFQIHIGSWYGWMLGGFMAWIAAGLVAGSYERYMLHELLP